MKFSILSLTALIVFVKGDAHVVMSPLLLVLMLASMLAFHASLAAKKREPSRRDALSGTCVLHNSKTCATASHVMVHAVHWSFTWLA